MLQTKKVRVMVKLTTEEFIDKAQKMHGDTYDYSKVVYVKSVEPVTIVCKIHGEFTQKPHMHLQGRGCSLCGVIKSAESKVGKGVTFEEFVQKAVELFGSKYTYYKDTFTNMTTATKITCAEHGDFYIKPSSHLKSPTGCVKCSHELCAKAIRLTTESFIEKASNIHNNKYTYGFTDYETNRTKVVITCPTHGNYTQIAADHLQGCGCPKCNVNTWRYSDWEKAGYSSKNFTGFKLYIIKCFSDTEVFYKIGKTYTTIATRFKELPYGYEVMYVVEADARTVSELETKYLSENRSNKYEPAYNFSGQYECFTKVELKDRGLNYGC